jgi:hypothetical protein
MGTEPTYTYQRLMEIIPIANSYELKHIISTVTKEKSFYGPLTMSKILREISKKVRVLASPVVMFGIAFLATW